MSSREVPGPRMREWVARVDALVAELARISPGSVVTALPPVDSRSLSERFDAVLRDHVIGPVTGGTATGSRWTCSCGDTALLAGTRGVAEASGRAHIANELAAEAEDYYAE